MRKRLEFCGIRWLYALLAMALMLFVQTVSHGQSSRPTRTPMSQPQTSKATISRPRISRRLTMPVISPNPSVNLGMIPMLSAYGMARPMQAGGMYPYDAGMPYGASGMYGGSQGYMQNYPRGEGVTAGPGAYTAEPQPDRQEKSSSSMLKASGLPNENDQLRWPIGLRILAAPETDELREQIDALFQDAAGQTAGGAVSSPLIDEMREAVKKFRRLLLKDKAERFGMPLAVYNESERFLNQLDHAGELLQAGLQISGEQDRLTTTMASNSSSSPAEPKQRENKAEVWLYDNYFQPKTISIGVGATVEWINHGHHRHTITLDNGQWSSLELNMNGIYKHPFTRPGIYHYHCSLHPQEMRGTIIVK